MPGANMVHENPWFSVSLAEEGDRHHYRVERADSALLIGLDSRGRFLMIRGTRDTTGAGEYYEFPCGGVESSEDPAAAAAREAREETGCEATNVRSLGSFVESPGVSASRCHVFAAAVSRAGAAHLEPGEDWTPTWVSPARLRTLIAEGEVQDGATLAAYARYCALENGYDPC